MELVLRDYQTDIINKTRQAFKDGFKSPIIVLPCGSGKTAVFAWMANQAQNNGFNVWFLVHRQELLGQTEETFKKFNLPVDKILIGMVQTVANNLQNYNKPNLIVFDEAHFSAAKTWGKIIEAFPNALKIGLTATPCRLDGRPLGNIYDTMITGISAKELINSGKLSDYVYFSVPLIKTDELKTKAGDYDIKQVVSQFENTVFADVVKTYKTKADNKKSICYCPTIEISEKTAAEFQRSGIEAIHFDGNTPEKQRKQIIADFRVGKIKILCNVDLISVGFDVPDCECCILLRPTKSLALYIQQSMRALRPLPGKIAIILDHVCNYAEHGLPDTNREWSL
ncbi:MAG TPA: helicase, partial [Flavobacterium sp.]|nr:helicase [Flavobacterium sp.]